MIADRKIFQNLFEFESCYASWYLVQAYCTINKIKWRFSNNYDESNQSLNHSNQHALWIKNCLLHNNMGTSM